MVDLAASLDWINLMTYDYHGTWETRAGMLAPLMRDPADPSDTNVDAQREHVPRRGRAGEEAHARHAVLRQGLDRLRARPAQRRPLPEVRKRSRSRWHRTIRRRAYKRYWSEAARVPYRYDAASRTFITYDDAESIRGKVEYLKRKALLGAMYWEIAVDRDHSLARTVSKGLER